MKKLLSNFLMLVVILGCQEAQIYDVVITNAIIFDGTGNPPYPGAIVINSDTIAAIGDLNNFQGSVQIDAQGQAVSPGFINMLSWSTESLIIDGRSMGEIKQGVTLEVMGEGWSMGPQNPEMKARAEENMDEDSRYDIDWTTLGEYLASLENRGITPNVASFVGATTLRIHEVGFEDRAPTEEELSNMKALAQEAMEEGAMGIGSSLIYAPAFYASTEELIELCMVASEYGGMYITHMRSEGNKFLEAVDETITIDREANLPAEIYYLKAAGRKNWSKMDLAIERINDARSNGIRITTDMYNYVAGATGLNASMPPCVQEGGYKAWSARLQDPKIRSQVREEMKQDADDWENLLAAAGSADNVLLV